MRRLWNPHLPHKHLRIKRESMTETPSKSPTLRERLQSPWLVIAQYFFNVLIVILIAFLAGNQAMFTDYLNGTGEQRDRERQQAIAAAEDRAEQSRRTLCDLIAALEADIGGQLQRISDAAGCKAGPTQPGEDQNTDPEQREPSTEGEDAGANGPTSNSSPSTDPDTPTGEAPTPPPDADGPSTPHPAPVPPASPEPPNEEEPPPPSEPDDRGGLSEDADLCVIILGCVV